MKMPSLKELLSQIVVAVVIAFFAILWNMHIDSKLNNLKVIEERNDIEELKVRIATLELLHLESNK